MAGGSAGSGQHYRQPVERVLSQVCPGRQTAGRGIADPRARPAPRHAGGVQYRRPSHLLLSPGKPTVPKLVFHAFLW